MTELTAANNRLKLIEGLLDDQLCGVLIMMVDITVRANLKKLLIVWETICILGHMKSRLNDIPILKSVPSYIGASHYNRVRLAQLRLEQNLRLELFSLRGLDILIDDEAWVCIDRTLGDLPVLAWTDFQTGQRVGVHQPVPCQLRFYHNHADLICGTVLDDLGRILERRLARIRSTGSKRVVYLGRTSNSKAK